MKKTTKVIVGSALTMAMCATLITGATLALFTSEDKVDIAVTSGKVDVEATIDELITTSLDWDGTKYVETTSDGDFTNGGRAYVSGSDLTIENISPGDAVKFPITVTNKSTISIKYRLTVSVEEDPDSFFDELEIMAETTPASDASKFVYLESEEKKILVTKWMDAAAAEEGEETISTVNMTIALPQEKVKQANSTCKMTFTVNAIQGNGKASSVCEEIGIEHHYNEEDICEYCGEAHPLKGHYALEGDGGSQKCVVTVDETMSGDLVIPSTMHGAPVEVEEAISDEDLNTSKFDAWKKQINDPDANPNEDLHIGTLVIQEGVDVGPGAFAAATIEHLVLEGNASYGSYAFALVKGLQDVTIKGETTLNGNIFNGSDIHSIDMSDATIETLPKEAFYECKNLENVKLPETLKEIRDNVFYDCIFKVLVLPKTLEKVYGMAFYSCTNLEKLVFQSVIKRGTRGYNVNGLLPSDRTLDLKYCHNIKQLCFTGTLEEWIAGEPEDTNGMQDMIYDGKYKKFEWTYSYEITPEDLGNA